MSKRLHLIPAILACAALAGCRAGRPAPVASTVAVTRSVVAVTDTVPVTLPRESASAIVPDSVSVLSTSCAVSSVRLRPDGSIHHTIANSPRPVPVPVTRLDTRVDSVSISAPAPATPSRPGALPGSLPLLLSITAILLLILKLRRT